MSTLFDGVLFPQSLQDLVKGIRAHRRDEAAYIRGKIAEITSECRASEPHKKANGVLKLTYLHMLGYPVDFASFYILEVMSRTEFAHKRVGYLAAGQVFSPTTDVLLLTTNLFKKDITAGRLSDCSHALNCVAKVATAELARELAPDVVTLLASPRPYIRKKATLTLYSLVAASPDILPAATVRLKDRLVDSDSSVVCAAVTVVAQLAAKSPRPFLVLAPVLYRILTDSHNNWLLIKVVKLFGVLAPLEPRLARKLAPPLSSLMKSTKAKSLLYECCSTVSLALLDEAPLVALAADHLGQFIMDVDQNLKYLGLAAMRRLAARFPAAVMRHRGLVLDCLDDADVGIRLRALDLVGALVHQDTFREVFDVLLDHLEAVAAVAGRASVAGLAGSGGATEEDGGGAGGGAGRHALSAIDTDAPFREVLATRLLDAGVFVRPTAPPVVAAGSGSAARRRTEPSKPEGQRAAVGSAAAGTAAAPSPSTAATPVSEAEANLSTISLADPAPVDKEAARRRTGGYLQLLTEDDFEWYVAEVLGCVARCSRSLSAAVTCRAAAQLVELPARVPAARPACVELALQLLQAGGESTGADSSSGDGPSTAAAVPASSVGTSADAAAAAPGGGHDANTEEVDSVEEDSDVSSTEDSSGLSGGGADNSGTAAVKATVTAAVSATVQQSRDATPLPAPLLAAAAWLIGEYAPLIPRPATGVVTALLAAVPAGGGARCVSSALKLYASVASSDVVDAVPRVDEVGDGGGGGGDSSSDATELRELLLRALPQLATSAVAEVQERASVTLALVNAAPPGSTDAAVLRDLFAAPLLPVDAGAQARLSLPPPAAAAGVDLSVPLLGTAERARLARDAAAAAAVDEADSGMEGRRASGRSSAAGRGASRGREASSLLSAGGSSGDGVGGGRVSSRRGGVAPRRPRGDRAQRSTAADAATLIDVAAGDDGGGGGGGGSTSNPRGGGRSRSAAAAILADVSWEPVGPDTEHASRGGDVATGADAAADSLYGELDFGIGGGAHRGDGARSASAGGGGGGRRRGGSAKPAKPRRKARLAAAAAAGAAGASGDVGQLVDVGDAAVAAKAPPARKTRAAKGTRAGTKKVPPPPPPSADSFLQ